MKKSLFFLVVILLVISCSCVLAESETRASYMFRGIPWYESLGSVREKLASIEGFKPSTFFPLSEHAKIDSWDGYYYYDPEIFVKDGGAILSYDSAPVAGYTTGLTLSFLYPVDGETINAHSDDALFCKATYKFSKDDIDNLQAIYTDLRTKLTDIYGEGVQTQDTPNAFTGVSVYTSTLWTAEDGSVIYLIESFNSLSGIACQVRLTYAAGDLNDRIGELKNLTDKGVVPEDHSIITDPSNHEGL